MIGRNILIAVAMMGIAGAANAATTFGDFQDGTTQNFGALTNSSGVQPWSSPVSGTVVTASGPGSVTGSLVLELTGTPAFNYGQSGGGALGFDIKGNNFDSAFYANNTIEFDWVPLPNGGSGGFHQLYNIILNSQNGGFTNIGGYGVNSTTWANCNQFYFTGYNPSVHHIVVPYTAYRDALLSAGGEGGWLQFAIQPNAGGGAPADSYFDNFQFTTTPEPASLSLLVLASMGLMIRRK